jgi:hypothetical protein
MTEKKAREGKKRSIISVIIGTSLTKYIRGEREKQCKQHILS